MITVPINFAFVVLAFLSVCVGIIFSRRKKLLILFVAIGLVLFTVPFIRLGILTSNAYDWTIVIERRIDESKDPKVIFIDQIEWITDYEKLKKHRGHTRTLLLNEKTTSKVWKVKGYAPISIEASIIYGRDKYKIFKILDGLEAGNYTFTLTFNEQDMGTWTIEQDAARPE